MNFLKRIFQNIRQKSVSFLSQNSTFNSITGMEDFYDTLNLNAYKDSLYLFIGVSMIRETVSSIPLEMYKVKGMNGDVEEVFDDPFLDLLERPNDKQTQKEFWKLALSYYLLAGETFWYLERESPTSVPTAMVNMRPDHVKIVLSENKREIVAYEFTQDNGTIIKISVDDVLHIKNIDPTNPARGMGVVRPATKRIITEQEASNYQANTFKNQGRPDIAIFTDTDLTTEDADDARKRWGKIYGKQEGSKVGFFGESVKDLKLLNVSPKEMDFINSQNFLRDDILASLHVPKAMITSDDVNLANSKTARINYLKEACMPVLDAFIDVINNKWLANQDQDRFITYESPVQEDRELLLKEATELKKSGIITQNEARSIMNYPEVDEGDEFDTPSGLFQLQMKTILLKKQAKKILKKRPILMKKLKAIEAITKMIEDENKTKDVKRGRSSVFHTEEMKEKYIKVFNRNIDRKSESFKDHLDVYNEDLLKRILKHQEDFGLSTDNIFDVSIEIIEAKKIFVPLMQDMFKKAGQDTMDNIASGFSTKASEQFYSVEAMLASLELRSEFFILSMLDTDYNQLKALITQGLADGKGINVIAQEMREYFDNLSVTRAKTIARTETGRLISEATDEAYRQSEVVTGKEWLTSRDAKVRDEHAMNEGVIVATGGTFPNGERFPSELSINCRCALAPAV